MVNATVRESRAVVVLLDEARHKRASAERARRLARAVTTDRIFNDLIRYADELEQTALALERRASTLVETIAKSLSLSAEVRSLVEEARARLEVMRPKNKKPS